jgi:hypothetical protein
MDFVPQICSELPTFKQFELATSGSKSNARNISALIERQEGVYIAVNVKMKTSGTFFVITNILISRER